MNKKKNRTRKSPFALFLVDTTDEERENQRQYFIIITLLHDGKNFILIPIQKQTLKKNTPSKGFSLIKLLEGHPPTLEVIPSK
jgi:hypothetical protein